MAETNKDEILEADGLEEEEKAAPAEVTEKPTDEPEAELEEDTEDLDANDTDEGDREDEGDDDDWDEDDDDEDDEDDDEDEDDPLIDLDTYHVKLKPELTPEQKKALALRKTQTEQRPAFRRQEWFRYKRLGTKWRRPKGLHSKQRRGLKYRPPTVKVGYGAPATVSGLHPSGFKEIMVHRPSDLDGLDAKTQAARIGGSVGLKKREDIHTRAAELNVRVLNPTRRRRAERLVQIPNEVQGGDEE